MVNNVDIHIQNTDCVWSIIHTQNIFKIFDNFLKFVLISSSAKFNKNLIKMAKLLKILFYFTAFYHCVYYFKSYDVYIEMTIKLIFIYSCVT